VHGFVQVGTRLVGHLIRGEERRIGRRHHLRRVVGSVQVDELGVK